MKQLTILCSSDLADKVRNALNNAGVHGFLQLPNAVGNEPGAAAEHGRVPRWEAEMFVAPVPADIVDQVVARLRSYAEKCEVEPCMRILVSSLDAVY
jgi:hypothetical protein